MKRFFGAVALAAVALTIALIGTASGASPTYSNGFETDTAGWFDNGGTIAQQSSAYVNPGGYASGINSASGGFHARLNRGPCSTDLTGGGGPTVYCSGPFTRWGGYGQTWYGGWTTQVDVYLDAAYAQANADSYSGNLAGLSLDETPPGNPTDPDVKGTRFDYSSAVNNAQGNFIRDFGFNVATGPDLHGNLTCTGFIATAGMNVNRSGADAYNPAFNPQCIPTSGWYTFKHTFRENMSTHFLEVLMEIIPVGSATPTASWTIQSPDPIASGDPTKDVGCNRYGWFTDQEMWGLPIDNASINGGCTAPAQVGKIAPTATTCQQYAGGTASDLVGGLQYTTKGGLINAVSPGVFFYYTKVSGTTGQTVGITENHTGAPAIPIQQGQVVLYSASASSLCKVLRWTTTVNPDGTATGNLPSSGDFIVGVKYSASDLKGKTPPASPPVTYSFGTTLAGNPIPADDASVVLAKK
jgi:hypothetical protein